ncbi:MAG TPA: HEAT repeat domain-containing protein [bacterium]|nr:HEAT repeat domain-containing protein [bacterium]
MAYTVQASGPAEGADRLREAQLALRRLATALKASQLYSFQHRNTMEPVDRFLETVDRYIEQYGPLALEVRRASFVLDFEDQVREDATVTPLVFSLDARGVKRLSFLRGVDADEIQHFLTVLTMPIGSVQAAGGFAPLLRDRKVEHISFQETGVVAGRLEAPPNIPVALDHSVECAPRREDMPQPLHDPEQAVRLLSTLLASGASAAPPDRAEAAYAGLRTAERAIVNALPQDRPGLYRNVAQALAASVGPEADALRALIARRAAEDPLAAALQSARDAAIPTAPSDPAEALPVETVLPAPPETSELTDVDEAGIRLEGMRALSNVLSVTRPEAAEPVKTAIEREMTYLPMDRDLGQLARLFIELHDALQHHDAAAGHAYLRKLLPRELMMRFVDPASAGDREAATAAVDEFWDALREDLLPVLLDTLATEERSTVRKAICRTAARMGRADLATVTARLGDPDWRLVRGAVDVLEEMHEPGTLRQIGRLLQHSDLRVRREAVRVLATWGTPEAMALVSATLLEADPETRRAVAAQLGVVGTPEAQTLLVEALSGHEPLPHEFAVHLEIIVALGQIGTPEALPALEPFVKTSMALMSPKQRTLRRAAEEAIREIQTRGRRSGAAPVP